MRVSARNVVCARVQLRVQGLPPGSVKLGPPASHVVGRGRGALRVSVRAVLAPGERALPGVLAHQRAADEVPPMWGGRSSGAARVRWLVEFHCRAPTLYALRTHGCNTHPPGRGHPLSSLSLPPCPRCKPALSAFGNQIAACRSQGLAQLHACVWEGWRWGGREAQTQPNQSSARTSQQVADPYVEMDTLGIFVAVFLHRPGAYVHVPAGLWRAPRTARVPGGSCRAARLPQRRSASGPRAASWVVRGALQPPAHPRTRAPAPSAIGHRPRLLLPPPPRS